ncbi:MAG: 50S ribosomal protein L23 [Patescibacteria group bacterium]
MMLFGKKKKKIEEESKEAEKKEAKLGLPEGKDPRFYKIIEKPVQTEKAVASRQNKYVFKVWRKTNKIEVRKAVEKLYEVKVKDVKIINTFGKKRQVGRLKGWKPGFKKAVVTLEKGHTIAIT